MDRKKLQQQLIEKMLQCGVKKILFDETEFNYNDVKMTMLCLVNKDYIELILANRYRYIHTDLLNTHIARLENLYNMLNTNSFSLNKFVGYETTDSKLFIRGEEKQGLINQYIMVDGEIKLNMTDTLWECCEACGKIIFKNIHDVNGCRICDECYQDKTQFVKCQICGKETFKPRLRTIYSHDKSFQDKVEEKFKLTFEKNAIHVCQHCKEENFIVCTYCDIIKLIEDGETHCQCRNERVYEYNYKPKKPKFLATKKPKVNTLFLGFENECEVNIVRGNDYPCDDCDEDSETCGGCDSYDEWNARENNSAFVKTLTDILGPIVYCKTDGSLDTGFEIISEPMTYEYIYRNKNKFSKAFKAIARDGAYSFNANTTGFHVHLSRRAFINKEHIEKFTYIIYKDKSLSEAIAKRNSCSYGHIDSFNTDKELIRYIKNGIENPEDRYKAVNFNNSNTIEVRIYKGNLNMDSVMLYLQHVVSIFNYTALAIKKHTDVSIDEYIKYVYNRSSKYKELKKEIKKIKGGN